MNDLHEMAANSREAAWTLAASSLETRNAALLRMAEVLENHQADIFAANAADIHQAEADGLAAPLLGRLKFREEKLRAVTDGLRALADLPDPIGATTMTHEITPGLKMYRVTCPIGVIGVIFESRPDALVQIASLALKSGNAVLLKGGREAMRTNEALFDILRDASVATGMPDGWCGLLIFGTNTLFSICIPAIPIRGFFFCPKTSPTNDTAKRQIPSNTKFLFILL